MRYIKFLIFLVPFVVLGQADLDKAKKFIADKHYLKAEQLLSKYVAKHETDKKSIELLGDAYGYQKKWDEASEYYKSLVDLEPSNANFQYKYGGALGMKALGISKFSALLIIDDVKTAFLKAAELDPNHIETRWALVELYMQLPGIIGGSKSSSLKYAEELQDLSTVDGYLAKGYIYEYDKSPDLAEKYYKMAIAEGGSFTCYEKLTTLYENEKQPEKAISTMEDAVKTHKRNAMHYQIGKVCAEYNIQLEKGENCLFTYIENHSAKDGVPKAWAYYRLAQIKRYKKDKVKALEFIDMAIVELPKIEPFRKERAQILKL
ncbi:hypothetical protein ESY86_12410 [Subsaximicrobium wynnwilliamsii]|uniref:Tetratricopeptide repeat protein n=1 Tax=Subsaximicrobium wynnwilliamsii TaxID=291179 RepID=A0A5C6ZES6_9FLAO|nr:hypothetical protein [Subsaximicrobium wynnwilliamsii]TXD82814.1 hypothetical protein ESY87_12445 [Subsaximicrobium wynnwilliamsii]TXD88537.1 hypothetical protein ESY86_12410 [Subsaximicrobium wynnwilliamsii]TXE02466.1 hypothetical protein ESY88_11955 [Subsaximicrobium wynnwilliamsii]